MEGTSLEREKGTPAMFRSIRALKLFVFSLVTIVVVIGAEASQVVAESFLIAEEDKMLSMVNDHRAGRGIQPLKSNDAYRWVARRHTQRMVSRGTIFHNQNLSAEADDAIPGWRLLGENVGMGSSVEGVQNAFLGSPRHRANIENPDFNTAGIGGAASASGRRYFTQNFAAWTGSTPPPPPPTAPPATAPPATAPPPTAPPPTAPPATAPPATAAPTATTDSPSTTSPDTPDPATPDPETPSGEATPDSPEEPGDASEDDRSETGDDDGGRAGFFEVLFGMLTRFVQNLGIG